MPTSRAKKLLLAFIGAPLLVLLLLLCAEGITAALGDPRRHFFERRRDEQGRELFVASADPPIPNTHFRVEQFAARPPAGTKRILCVGDSTCFGHPFDPPVPFPCWLELRLKTLLEEPPVEVVNLGSSGFCSEDVLDLLRDVEGGGADIVVVYVGHNEFLDRNLLPILEPATHAMQRLLRASRFGSWVASKLARPRELLAITERAHAELVHDEPLFTQEQFERGRRRYREHLEEIVALARARSSAVLLCHPVADLVDTPPEYSAFAPTTASAGREGFRTELAELQALRQRLDAEKAADRRVDPGVRGELHAAHVRIDALLAVDPQVALLHYERGRLFLLGQEVSGRPSPADLARTELGIAFELDGYPIRARSDLHEVIDAVARATGVGVADPRPLFLADAAKAPNPTLPGHNGWFVDYCHPELHGHELLAEALLRAMARNGLLAPEARWRFESEPSVDEYRRRAGYDPAKQAESWARNALFGLGRAYFDANNEAALRGAENLLERALALDGRCASAWVGRGVIAMLRKQTDAALAAFDQACAFDPKAVDLLVGPYNSSPQVHALFEAAGLAIEGGRVVRTP